MPIREARPEDHDEIIFLIQKLSEWFTREAREKEIPFHLHSHRGFVAEKSDKIVGFITLDSDFGEAKIGWIGVHPENQREGIGKRLVNKVEKEFKNIGAKKLRVDSVGEKEAEGTPYEGTIKFYKALGFKAEEVVEGKFDEGKTDITIYRKSLK